MRKINKQKKKSWKSKHLDWRDGVIELRVAGKHRNHQHWELEHSAFFFSFSHPFLYFLLKRSPQKCNKFLLFLSPIRYACVWNARQLEQKQITSSWPFILPAVFCVCVAAPVCLLPPQKWEKHREMCNSDVEALEIRTRETGKNMSVCVLKDH